MRPEYEQVVATVEPLNPHMDPVETTLRFRYLDRHEREEFVASLAKSAENGGSSGFRVGRVGGEGERQGSGRHFRESLPRHSRESGNPLFNRCTVMQGATGLEGWIPAFAGMTGGGVCGNDEVGRPRRQTEDGMVAWAIDWTQARALLPLAPETLDGLLWMEYGAGEELNAKRTS